MIKEIKSDYILFASDDISWTIKFDKNGVTMSTMTENGWESRRLSKEFMKIIKEGVEFYDKL